MVSVTAPVDILVKRLVLAALLMLVLSACASLATTSSSRLVAPSGAPIPAPRTPAPTPPTSPPMVAQPPPPPATRMLSGAFSIVAIGRSGVSGSVEVSQSGGRFVATVSARGLPLGMATLHTVHIHLGSCANPYGGAHLTVLGILGTNAGGTGSFSAPLAGTYVSSGRYVIIYASLAARTIIGCANLGAV
jgi:hypothetical protein